MTLGELFAKYPGIDWLSPVIVNWPGPLNEADNSVTCTQTYACRVCIANLGFNRRSPHQWPTEVEARTHFRMEHCND